ncbi:MAG: LysR family transcriptional regulator [Ruminococcus sp.]
MDLKQLKYFIVCAETGSISEAARLLYTTQPSVSKAIKALENDIYKDAVFALGLYSGITLPLQGVKTYRYTCRIMK